MRNFVSYFLFILCSFTSLQALAQFHPNDDIPWDRKNRPLWFGQNYEYEFSHLPTKGESTIKPWADTYWPSYQGGIANRWMAGGEGFDYKLYSLAELQERPELVAGLSPAEKYDLYRGDYSYPTVESEWRRVSRDNESWEGLCHGWAPASLNFDEPKSVTRTNPDGLKITFGSSDVKALLTYLYGVRMTRSYSSASAFLGARCNLKEYTPLTAHIVGNRGVNEIQIPRKYYEIMQSGMIPEMDECDDMNAGAFHVALTNEIGLKKKGIVADIDRKFQVWNQPVFGYSAEIVSDQIPVTNPTERFHGIVKKALVNLTISYGQERSPNAEPIGTSEGLRMYSYSLDLNADGEIVGGDWISEARPDFIWKGREISDLSLVDWALADIYESSVVR